MYIYIECTKWNTNSYMPYSLQSEVFLFVQSEIQPGIFPGVYNHKDLYLYKVKNTNIYGVFDGIWWEEGKN